MKAPKVTTIAQKKLNTELTNKRKADTTVMKKKAATNKNSLAPKRPPSSFFIFMEEFRKAYKENFPDNKSVSVVGKAGGEKWKSMSESEKAPYVAKAAMKKAEYGKVMEEFSKNSNSSGDQNSKAEESEKSSSEVHDEDEVSS